MPHLKMRFHKQKTSLQVRDLMPVKKNNGAYQHSPLLPNSLRCIICGPSNCGKTNVMLSLLYDPNGLRFENVYVYSKSLYQPKYELLKDLLKMVEGVRFYPFSDTSEIMDPEEAKTNSIFIFDDVACHTQNRIREYFSMGRHKQVDCFYLCQTYTRIPKHLIRDNSNFLILFKMDELNLKHIYDDHVGSDMKYQSFNELCSECWNNEKYNFVVIDKDSPLNEGRYRCGFDTFIEM